LDACFGGVISGSEVCKVTWWLFLSWNFLWEQQNFVQILWFLSCVAAGVVSL